MTERGLVYSQGQISGSRSTVISIVPFPIHETKPGLIPGEFHIPPSKNEEPTFLTMGDSMFYVYIDAERGNLRVPAPSAQVARSVCFDYLTAQLEAKPDCHPGLFWKEGEWNKERLMKESPQDLEYYKKVQYNWFVELVKRADDDWEKTRVHYAISDIQRYALRAIDPKNSKNRPWLITNKPGEESPMIHCPSCGSDLPRTAVVCRYCQYVVDQNRYKVMQYTDTTTKGLDLDKIIKAQ